MADISALTRLVNGIVRTVDISANTLVTTSIKVGGLTPTELTKTILDRLISLQNGTDVDATYHTHDGRYFTKTQLGSTANGTSGASLIGIDVTPAFTNFTPSANTVQGALEGIDTALGASSGANTSLSNLITTSINQDLVPDSDATRNLGSAAKGFLNLYVTEIRDASDVKAIDTTATNRKLYDSAGLISANWDSRKLYDGSALESLDYQSRILKDSSGDSSADWENRLLKHSGGFKTVDWQNYQLLHSDGTVKVEWVNGLLIDNVANNSINWQSRLLLDASEANSINWTSRKLFANDGSTEMFDWSTSGVLDAKTNKITNLAAATANGDAVRFEQAVLTDGSHPITGDQSFSSTAKITNLVDPTNAQDGATKSYVDNAIAGLSWKQAVSAASVADVSIASAPSSLDGYTLVSLDRILLKDQSAPAENGIYIFNGSGNPLTRSIDFDSWNEVVGAVVYVEQGTINAGSKWVDTNIAGGTLDSTAITFTIFAAASALDGVGTSGYNAYWTAAHTLAAEQYVAASRGGLATDVSAFTGLLKASAGTFSASALVNADVAAGAAIAYSKLNLSASIVNADVAAGAAIVYSKLSLSNSIVNVDIASGAAIAYSKLNLSASIVNADISTSAAIAYSKLALTNSIVLGDLTSDSVDENKIKSSSFDGISIVGGSGTKISAQGVRKSFTAGESFAANTSYAVRIALTGETAGRVYKADFDASVSDKFYAYGMIEGNGAAALSAGDPVSIVMMGTLTLGSGDTNFASGEIGQPVHLMGSGAWDAVSQITYAADQASYRLGMVQTVSTILVGNMQLLGVY